MKVKEIMTGDVEVITPNSNLQEAASKMKQVDIGCLPVCDGDRLIGMITDRDLVIRGISENRDCFKTQVKDVMSSPIVYCFEDQDTEECARLMETKQIRRLVVLDRNKRLVGIASLDDLAKNQALAGEILSQVTNSMQRRVA